ncbi:hypothetical protein FO488_15975 [Geobacter sp. FeAm09]|uniref:hypothetical protein n=1 Tax=Geobacter sp. FeAm09 TaxID=2597769 RepID=UPI0011ECDC92|nr:hypothetical protein [Geobacter sp. FeAm09]QEM69506.1 hypothetical protein FO488_15975 [Geobacter sp. FeAm09]
MITAVKWAIGGIGSTAVAVLLYFEYATHEQQKMERKMDVRSMRQEKVINDVFLQDKDFVPDKKTRDRYSARSAELDEQIKATEKTVEGAQGVSDAMVRDARRRAGAAGKDLDKMVGSEQGDPAETPEEIMKRQAGGK